MAHTHPPEGPSALGRGMGCSWTLGTSPGVRPKAGHGEDAGTVKPCVARGCWERREPWQLYPKIWALSHFKGQILKSVTALDSHSLCGTHTHVSGAVPGPQGPLGAPFPPALVLAFVFCPFRPCDVVYTLPGKFMHRVSDTDSFSSTVHLIFNLSNRVEMSH